MVLRLWIEPGTGIRVRITQTTDVESGRSRTSYASTLPDVIALVQAWLDETESPLHDADNGNRN